MCLFYFQQLKDVYKLCGEGQPSKYMLMVVWVFNAVSASMRERKDLLSFKQAVIQSP